MENERITALDQPLPLDHGDHGSGTHHHHSHASASSHAHGHHLLQVESLSIGFQMYDPEASFFKAKQRMVNVIDNLSIAVHEGEIVAVVGASGSGKTLLADAIMGIYEPNAQVSGRIWFDGELKDAAGLAHLRGCGISMIPQSVASLNPLMKVGRQVQGWGSSESKLRAERQRARQVTRHDERQGDRSHGERQDAEPAESSREGRRHREQRQRELFRHYGLADEAADLYPYELSGGMARRVLFCCALMDDPRVIIADEPTPGLDLDLAVRALDDLRTFADDGGGVMLITHDIELALRVADRIAVFHEGTVVEETAVANFASPELLQHPFSRALWHALPEHGFVAEGEWGGAARA